MHRRWLTVAILVSFLLVAESVWACPTCKDSIAGDPASANLARGFYFSILFMLSMPYLILTGIGLYFYNLVRKARREREGAAQASANTAVTAIGECPPTRVQEEQDELVGV